MFGGASAAQRENDFLSLPARSPARGGTRPAAAKRACVNRHGRLPDGAAGTRSAVGPSGMQCDALVCEVLLQPVVRVVRAEYKLKLLDLVNPVFRQHTVGPSHRAERSFFGQNGGRKMRVRHKAVHRRFVNAEHHGFIRFVHQKKVRGKSPAFVVLIAGDDDGHERVVD